MNTSLAHLNPPSLAPTSLGAPASSRHVWQRRPVAGVLSLLGALLALLLAPRVQATLPDPDNVLYGTIVIGTNVVTARSTNVVVEIRRTPTGPALSSYRMGETPGFGDHYSINIALESLDPNSLVNPGTINPNASLPGDTLFLIVRDRNVIRFQNSYVVSAPGTIRRLDFGTSPAATLIDQWQHDQWQQSHFGRTGLNMDTYPTGKGQSLQADYIAGTNPNNTNSLFKLNITRNDATEISFMGIRAEGPGYAGLSRLYNLEYSTNLMAGTWRGIPGRTNLVGNNQTILYVAPPGGAIGPFYRAQVRLTGP